MAKFQPGWLLLFLLRIPSKIKAGCRNKLCAFSLSKILLSISIVILILFIRALNRLNLEEERLDIATNISSFPNVYFKSPKVLNGKPSDFNSPWYCDVDCMVGVPCEYKDEVDFRVIVITYNRAKSLQKCLDAVFDLDTLGDKVSVEIWIDRSKNGTITKEAIKTAEMFIDRWSIQGRKGRACVHQQKANAYINGQWIDTWRPKQDSKELAVILEDDVSISPHAYRWMKAAHSRYGYRSDIAGYTLQMEDVMFFAPTNHAQVPMKAAEHLTAFMYPVLGTWGYAPHPKAWRAFQEWYHRVRPDRDVKTDLISPNVPEIIPDLWYQALHKQGKQESMWEMWHIKFTHDLQLFTLYSNMQNHASENHGLLCTNRKEDGLHYSGASKDNTEKLLKQWDPTFANFPANDHIKSSWHIMPTGSGLHENKTWQFLTSGQEIESS